MVDIVGQIVTCADIPILLYLFFKAVQIFFI